MKHILQVLAILCLAPAILLVAGRHDLAAQQGKNKKQPSNGQSPFPFFPPGFGNGSPDQMFEKMFGASTPEEEQALAKVKISIQEETEFGKPVLQAYLDELEKRQIAVIRKGKDVDYLRQLVETVRPFTQNPKRYPKLTVWVIDSPEVDARSFAGGTLVFYKGLLDFAENEAALIGIVGHELSHLDRGHLLVPLKRTRVMQEKFTEGFNGFDPQRFFSEGTMMMRLMGRPFRPEDEAAADHDGAEWAWRAGYDPRELAGLFERLHKKNNDQKVPLGTFFRTHPYNEDRTAAILKQHDELQAKQPKDQQYIGKKNLKLRIAKSKQEFPE